jgi:hypothetical protein
LWTVVLSLHQWEWTSNVLCQCPVEASFWEIFHTSPNVRKCITHGDVHVWNFRHVCVVHESPFTSEPALFCCVDGKYGWTDQERLHRQSRYYIYVGYYGVSSSHKRRLLQVSDKFGSLADISCWFGPQIRILGAKAHNVWIFQDGDGVRLEELTTWFLYILDIMDICELDHAYCFLKFATLMERIQWNTTSSLSDGMSILACNRQHISNRVSPTTRLSLTSPRVNVCENSLDDA